MTEDYIYVNGCSYTYGIGIDTRDIPALRWPTLLGKELGLEVLNDACPGSSNMRIARTTFNNVLNQELKPKLAIIMWSDCPRQEYWRPQEIEYDFEDMVQVTPQGVGAIKSYYHRDAFESFFSFINSEERGLVHTLYNMMSIQTLFDSIGVPVVQLHYKPNTNRYYRHFLKRYEDSHLDDKACNNIKAFIESSIRFLEKNPHTFGFSKSYSFQQLCDDKKLEYSKISLGHPSEKGHREMANWIVEYLRNNDDLNKRL